MDIFVHFSFFYIYIILLVLMLTAYILAQVCIFLIGFHSVGKASKLYFFTIFFYQMVPFFQVWSIKGL